MSVFKRCRLLAEIILLCVRWYCRYGISYRDLEEMMAERGVAVDHVTLYRWAQRYAPELEKRVSQAKCDSSISSSISLPDLGCGASQILCDRLQCNTA